MTTVYDLKTRLFLQYAIERIFENYYDCENDSERYLVKIDFLIFVEEGGYSLKEIKSYMELQSEKFEVFLNLINNITQESSIKTSKSKSKLNISPVEVRIFTCNN